MRITDIKAQVKRNDRYSIYGDGKYVFSLSENELLNSGIKIKQEYDGEELEKLQMTVVLDKAYDRSLNMISRRPRSIWEMRQYLKQKDYDDNVIEEILNKLSNRKYLDEEKFAEAWLRDRRILKRTSKRRLQQELRAKKVSDSIIQKVLAEDEADEQDILRELIEKKRMQSRYQDDQKLIQYLIRQGFNYSDIKDLISN